MWRIDIGSSVSPENESGNTLGFAGVDAGRGAPGFFLGFAAVGSPEALSKMAPRSLILGEDSTPVSTRTCARAGTATCAAARKTIAVKMLELTLTRYCVVVIEYSQDGFSVARF